MSDDPVKSRKIRVTPTEFVVKSENADGTVTWVHPTNAEEIILNNGTVPTAELLSALAANGLVPTLPTLDEFNERIQFNRDEVEEPERDTALSRVLARMKNAGDDVRSEVKVYRVKQDGSEIYCCKFTIEEYDENGDELIRTAFGGGKFRVRVYGPKESPGNNYGKFVRLTNELVEIEHSLIPLKTDTNTQNSALPHILEAMNKKIDSITTGGANSADFNSQMQMFMQMQKAFGPPPQKSLVEQINELEALKNFKAGLSEDKEDSGNGMMAIAGQVLSMIKPAMAQPSAPSPTAIPNVQLPQAFETVQAAGDDVNFVEKTMLGVMVGALLKAAERGESVDTHAEGLIDKLPDEIFDLLETPLWFDVLIEYCPGKKLELETRKVWFTALKDKILVLANQPE